MNHETGVGHMETTTVGVEHLGSYRVGQGAEGCYLVEGELPCELGPQHDHAAHPEQQEVTARFQK